MKIKKEEEEKKKEQLQLLPLLLLFPYIPGNLIIDLIKEMRNFIKATIQ